MFKGKRSVSYWREYDNYYAEYGKNADFPAGQRGFKGKIKRQFIASVIVFIAMIGILQGNINDEAAKNLLSVLTEDDSLAQSAEWMQAKAADFLNEAEIVRVGSFGGKINQNIIMVTDGRIISSFGWQKDEEKFNKGIILETDGKKEIRAIYEATVKEVRKEGEYYTIILEANDGIECIYSNCTDITVKEQDKVRAGDILGYSGECSVIKGRVYLEVKRFGEPIDPLGEAEAKKV